MSELEQRPKRLSLSEIVELLLTRQSGDRSSVTLSRSASGETLIDVKVSTSGADGIPTVGDASSLAQDVYESLRAAYPAGEPRDASSVSLSRNAKGETQIEVTVRAGDGPIETVEDAAERAQAVYDKARREYPMANGLTAKPGSVA